MFVLFSPSGPAGAAISPLSLHDALPIFFRIVTGGLDGPRDRKWFEDRLPADGSVALDDVTSAWCTLGLWGRSEEHTSELQALRHLVCRLLLEKKKSTHRRRAPSPRRTPR